MGGPNANVNSLSTVHQGSGGMAMATPPDVCMTPGPSGPPMPVPYPNIAMSTDLVGGTTTVMVNDQLVATQPSKFIRSSGDEPGVAGGVMSGVNMQQASWLMSSPTVTMEDAPVCRLSDKMLMNMSNTACVSGEVQAPVPPPMPLVMPPPEKPKECKFQGLKVKCGHGSRGYELEAEKDPGSSLQVITGNPPEKIKVDFQGQCSVHNSSPGCAKVHALGWDGKDLAVGADNSIVVAPPASWANIHKDWMKFFGFLVGNDVAYQSITVYGTTCDGTASEVFNCGEFVVVDVYPKASLAGEITLGFEWDKQEVDKTNPQKAAHQLEQASGKWVFGGKISTSVGDNAFEITFGDSHKGDDPATRGLFRGLTWFIGKIANFLGRIADFYASDIKIRWPSIKLAADLKLAEGEGKPQVGREGSFSISCEPLLGAEFTTDILEWLIVASSTLLGPGGPAFGRYLVQVKKNLEGGALTKRKGQSTSGPGENEVFLDNWALEKKEIGKDSKLKAGAKLAFGIDLTVGGDINGTVGFKAKVLEPAKLDDDSNKIYAGLDFKLEAFIKVEAKIFVVLSAAAGASLSMLADDGTGPSRVTGGLKLKTTPRRKNGKPAGEDIGVDGVFEFSGLAIYYAYYAEVSVGGNLADLRPAKPGAKKDDKTASPKLSKTMGNKKGEKLCTLLEASKFPREPTPGNVLKAL